MPRPATEGRGAYWKLEAGAEAQIFRRMARNYNRPKPVSFARQNIYYCDTTDINTVFITVPTWSGFESQPIQSVEQSFIFVLVFWRIQNAKKKKKFILVQIFLSGSPMKSNIWLSLKKKKSELKNNYIVNNIWLKYEH